MTIDKLGWIYIKNKKLLGVRSKGKDVYYIPGGKRERGETVRRIPHKAARFRGVG